MGLSDVNKEITSEQCWGCPTLTEPEETRLLMTLSRGLGRRTGEAFDLSLPSEFKKKLHIFPFYLLAVPGIESLALSVLSILI